MTRFGYVMTTYFAMLGIGALAFFHPAPRLIWNATASTPTGLYALHPLGTLHTLELVVVRPPEPIASYLADGGFLPKGVPLLKHVMALSGQTVCRDGDVVTVDQVEVGVAHWCTFGLADAKLRSGGASANPSPCRDGQRRLPLDGPHETRRAAGAGRPRRTTG